MARPRVTKLENQVITKRPNRTRHCYTMSNGQVLSVWFRRRWTKPNKRIHAEIRSIWVVAIHVGDNKRTGNKWTMGKRDHNVSTGTGGLEAAMTSVRCVREFCNSLNYESEMRITWSEGKRGRAYRFLLKYPEFAYYTKEVAGKKQCIAGRNPKYWTWDDQANQFIGNKVAVEVLAAEVS